MLNSVSLNEGEILRREQGWICGLSMKGESRRSGFGLMMD